MLRTFYLFRLPIATAMSVGRLGSRFSNVGGGSLTWTRSPLCRPVRQGGLPGGAGLGSRSEGGCSPGFPEAPLRPDPASRPKYPPFADRLHRGLGSHCSSVLTRSELWRNPIVQAQPLLSSLLGLLAACTLLFVVLTLLGPGVFTFCLKVRFFPLVRNYLFSLLFLP